MKTMRKKVLVTGSSRRANKKMAAVEFLMPENTDFITCQLISVNGGLC